MTDDAVLGTDELDDFDLLSAGYRDDPPATWRAMRERCPVARTSHHGGGWMLSTYDDITRVAMDTATFSSRAGEVTGPIPEPGRGLLLPPETSDPPHHADHRRLLAPFFTRSAVAELEPLTTETAQSLLSAVSDRLDAGEVVDAVDAYARRIPVTVTTRLIGLPAEDEDQFATWLGLMLTDGAEDFRIRAGAIRSINTYLRDLLRSRAGDVPGGLFARLREEQRHNPELSDSQAVGMGFLMLLGGIDTVWNTLGSSLWHLATHAEDRRVLAGDPALVPGAVQELLRMYAPVTIGRVVTADTIVAGRRLRAGERVIIPWGAANRDPQVQEHPEEVCLHSGRDRHLTFGYGPHRCLGAPLATMELTVALREWLRELPEFELADQRVEWTGGSTRGPKQLMIRVARSGVGRHG